MAVVPRVREQAELPVQEDHRVASLEKVLRGISASRARAEVVLSKSESPAYKEGHQNTANSRESELFGSPGARWYHQM